MRRNGQERYLGGGPPTDLSTYDDASIIVREDVGRNDRTVRGGEDNLSAADMEGRMLPHIPPNDASGKSWSECRMMMSVVMRCFDRLDPGNPNLTSLGERQICPTQTQNLLGGSRGKGTCQRQVLAPLGLALMRPRRESLHIDVGVGDPGIVQSWAPPPLPVTSRRPPKRLARYPTVRTRWNHAAEPPRLRCLPGNSTSGWQTR